VAIILMDFGGYFIKAIVGHLQMVIGDYSINGF
jgi:hypothetical protein